MAIQLTPDGRRILYLAHESEKTCLSIVDVKHDEIGHYTPATLPRNPDGMPQINHAIIDENGLIYANDRFSGGLYILRYTGEVPLD